MEDVLHSLTGLKPRPEEWSQILQQCKKIAVVGLSPKESRDSNKVARYLLKNGYDVVPVNPGQREILGRTCYKSLSDIPFQVDMANLFLNPARVPPVVDQAIKAGIKVVWMQLGVIHLDTAKKAREAGLQVIMDRCIMVEHRNWVQRLSEGV